MNLADSLSRRARKLKSFVFYCSQTRRRVQPAARAGLSSVWWSHILFLYYIYIIMCNGQWRAVVAAHFRLRCGAANAVNCKFKTIFITAQTFHTLFCLPPEKICVVIAVPTFVNSPTGPNHQPQSKGMRRPQTEAGLAAREKLGQDWQRGKDWPGRRHAQ